MMGTTDAAADEHGHDDGHGFIYESNGSKYSKDK
jgi:hypothetical protein